MFNFPALKSLIISYLMIIFASFRSFILNLSNNHLLIYFIAFSKLVKSAKLSTWTPTMINYLFFLNTNRQKSALIGSKLIPWENLMIVLFKSVSACFYLYKLWRILQTNLSRPVCFFWRIFIKIGCLFCPNILSK